jgi:hypothetical protein
MRKKNFLPISIPSLCATTDKIIGRINEVEGKEKEAELLLRQAEDEARQREEEDDNLRKQEENKNRVEADRKQRELRDEMDRQRLSGDILCRQLTETVDPDNPSGSMRAASVSGMSSSAISLVGLFQQNPAPPPIQIDPSSSSILPVPITTMISSVPEAVIRTTSTILQHGYLATSGPAKTLFNDYGTSDYATWNGNEESTTNKIICSTEYNDSAYVKIGSPHTGYN